MTVTLEQIREAAKAAETARSIFTFHETRNIAGRTADEREEMAAAYHEADARRLRAMARLENLKRAYAEAASIAESATSPTKG